MKDIVQSLINILLVDHYKNGYILSNEEETEIINILLHKQNFINWDAITFEIEKVISERYIEPLL